MQADGQLLFYADTLLGDNDGVAAQFLVPQGEGIAADLGDLLHGVGKVIVVLVVAGKHQTMRVGVRPAAIGQCKGVIIKWFCKGAGGPHQHRRALGQVHLQPGGFGVGNVQRAVSAALLIQIGVDGSGDGAGQAVERKLIGRGAPELDLLCRRPMNSTSGSASQYGMCMGRQFSARVTLSMSKPK